MDFKYTHTSLNKVYEMSYKHAIENIKRNGGTVNGDRIVIEAQQPKAVKWEQSFTDLKPVDKKWIGKTLDNDYEFEFTGDAFVIAGECRPKKGTVDKEGITHVANVEVYIDGKLNELIKLPASFTVRRHEIAWKYQLENAKHTVKLKLLNPDSGSECLLSSLLIYSKK
jgi:hypothetical protein